MPKAIITGISGQDGSFLARHLISKGIGVIGLTRDKSQIKNKILDQISSQIEFEEVNYSNSSAIGDTIQKYKPEYFYNFAAYSSGAGMFDQPLRTGQINGFLVHEILECLRHHSPKTRFLQASSREIYGNNPEKVFNEMSNKSPISPYGAAKLYADNLIDIYRSHFQMFTCSAILFNHESPLRTERFVTKKIVKAAVEVHLGKRSTLELGDLSASRDWGYAQDFIEAMHLMLEASAPNDYVIATGKLHSIRDFCHIAFDYFGLDYNKYVKTSDSFIRKTETLAARGDYSAIQKDLNWEPKTSLKELIRIMIEAELVDQNEIKLE